MNNDDDLRTALGKLTPSARDILRRTARADQGERDELAHRLLREPGGQPLADLVDRMTLNPDLRRLFARLLGELEASLTPDLSRRRPSMPRFVHEGSSVEER
jgi:hypothetical protein